MRRLNSIISLHNMESDTHTATNRLRSTFRHQPLEHDKPSIRLIHLLPDLSPDGLIQCEIVHETIEAPYTCLSYRWGAPDPSSSILINGQLFAVRQNLLDFLDMARKNGAATMIYWIDALCIDQDNILERNHQVAQMGDIFSQATCVNIWLGATTADKDITPALRVLRDPENASPQQWGLVSAVKQDLEDYICGNPYWERAWIVQEIFLARKVLVWLSTETIPFEYLHWATDYFYLGWRGFPFAKFKLSSREVMDPKVLISKFEDAKRLYHGTNLQSLLKHFSGMKCEHPRDHVFSLSSLCCEGTQFPVDYGSTDSTVLIEALRHCCLTSCLCMPSILAESMGLGVNFRDLKANNNEDQPYMEVEMSLQGLGHIFDVCYVGGERFAIRALNWHLPFQKWGQFGHCNTLGSLGTEVSQLRYITDVSSHLEATSTYSEREFSGTLNPPTGYTLSSYIQKHGGMWVSVGRYSYMYAVNRFSIQICDSTRCMASIPLSDLVDSKLWPSSCHGASSQADNNISSAIREAIGNPSQKNAVKWRICVGKWSPISACLGRLHTPDYYDMLS